MFYVQADDPQNVQIVSSGVVYVLATRHRSGARYKVWDLSGILEAARNISRALRALLIMIALIILAASGVGIMNIMLVTVTERTREIGIRRAFGTRRAPIRYRFLYEALIISGTGALVGIAIALQFHSL